MSPRWRRADNVTYEVVDERAILVDAAGSELITLNPVGTLVWQRLDGRSELADVIDRLAATFTETPRAQLETDVDGFVGELRRLNLIVEHDAAG